MGGICVGEDERVRGQVNAHPTLPDSMSDDGELHKSVLNVWLRRIYVVHEIQADWPKWGSFGPQIRVTPF